MTLSKKNFLTLKDFTGDEISYLVDLSCALKAKKQKRQYDYLLKDRSIAVIFEKASTRTRCATSVACYDEGAHAEYLGKHDIQMGKKESVKDTARVLGRMFDAIMYRGYKQETVDALAKYSGIPVVNALTDEFHPTQIIADLMTIKEYYGSLDGIKLTFLGDSNNNVCNSLIIGAAKMGMSLSIGAPKQFWPNQEILEYAKDFSNNEIVITEDPFEAVHQSDVVYTDVWLSMGQEADSDAYRKISLLKQYQVDEKIMQATQKDKAIFMHCLPASHVKGIHDLEVSESIFESDRSLVFDQAENRLHSIKAILVALLQQ